MERPRILVLLAACNGAAWIGEQIRSILEQRNVEVHLIIRDDGSSDGTPDIVRGFEADCTTIALLQAEVSSGSASQNFFAMIRSCDATRFDFVALSDQDDVWNAEKLQQAVSMLVGSSAAGQSSAVTATWPDGRTRVLRQESATTESDFLFEGAGQGCTFVLSSEFYARLRSFLQQNQSLTSEVHFHDWAIYALARTWGLSWRFDPQPTMLYRQHAHNDIGARTSVRGMALRLRRIRDGWYARQIRVISDLCNAARNDNPIVVKARRILSADRGLGRRWALAWLCARGGRRKLIDNAALVLAAVGGWLER